VLGPTWRDRQHQPQETIVVVSCPIVPVVVGVWHGWAWVGGKKMVTNVSPPSVLDATA
jgi:hypothetical protein